MFHPVLFFSVLDARVDHTMDVVSSCDREI